MGKLISVVGNTGVGKTTLVRLLSEKAGFVTGLEGHQEHPFQALFKLDPRYALANQADYLLLRANQEQAIRAGSRTGILDGGLEMDFFVFSSLFFQKGLLAREEFALLENLYQTLRTFLPPPDVVIAMHAAPEITAERFRRRGRPLEIAALDDMQTIQGLLQAWLKKINPASVIEFDATAEDPTYCYSLPDLLAKINDKLEEGTP